ALGSWLSALDLLRKSCKCMAQTSHAVNGATRCPTDFQQARLKPRALSREPICLLAPDPRSLVGPRGHDDLEVGALHACERLEPAQPTVRGDRHEPVAAVVRDEHAVTLEPLENGPRMRRKRRRVEVLAKPQPFPHPGQIRIRL